MDGRGGLMLSSADGIWALVIGVDDDAGVAMVFAIS
jgi:hypothetical protein